MANQHRKVAAFAMSEFPSVLTHAWLATRISQEADSVVTTWTDEISGVELAQSDALKKPLYRTSVNGYAAVDFDGVDDYLFASDAALMAMFSSANGSTPAATLWFVCSNRASTGAPRFPFAFGRSSSDNTIWSLSGLSTNDLVYLRSDTASLVRSSFDPASTGSKRVLTLQTKSALEYATYLNRDANQSGVAPNGGFTVDRFAVGGLLRTAFTNPSPIDVHAILVANKFANASERTAVLDFLTSEFGTP